MGDAERLNGAVDAIANVRPGSGDEIDAAGATAANGAADGATCDGLRVGVVADDVAAVFSFGMTVPPRLPIFNRSGPSSPTM